MSKGATRKRSKRQAARSSRLLQAARRGLVTLGCLAALAAFAAVTWKLGQMPVEQVVVRGELEHVSRDQLQQMVLAALGDGFLGADLQALRAPLEALPWVYRVSVRRRWPSTLEIQVTEELPIARWGEDGFLNHEGDVFTPADGVAVADPLPRLQGPAGSERELVHVFQLLQARLAPARLGVDRLHMDERGGLRVGLVDGPELVMGRAELEDQLERFLAVYRVDLAQRHASVRSVDLRYRHGLAVAWRDG